MNTLLNSISNYAKNTPKMCALRGVKSALTYAQLNDLVAQYAAQFKELKQPIVAICVENHPAWIVLDLAAMRAEITLVPIPFFFSASQQLHALEDAGVNYFITDRPAFYRDLLSSHLLGEDEFAIDDKALTRFCLTFNKLKPTKLATKLPINTAKITYTSGTTGRPKGVCLSTASQLAVAQSLQSAVNMQADEVHLCVLPLSTLLENIAGVYTPLLSGGVVVILPADDVGVNLENTNNGGLNVQKMLDALMIYRANTAVLTPELLLALTSRLEDMATEDKTTTTHLRFLAVGGASVSPSLLARAHEIGLPVFEGYGLSECCSVVALNTEQQSKMSSVGKLLPHVRLQFAKDGEILAQGATLLGYTNQPKPLDTYYPTGDIGRLDADGYLYIIGRKKNMFITSFGRNVSPEWVERELKVSPFITQAILFGEAKPWNTLIVTPSKNALSVQIQTAIDAVNANLPDYARVNKWFIADTPFSKANSQLTVNGRLRREAIWQQYQSKINALYQTDLATHLH